MALSIFFARRKILIFELIIAFQYLLRQSTARLYILSRILITYFQYNFLTQQHQKISMHFNCSIFCGHKTVFVCFITLHRRPLSQRKHIKTISHATCNELHWRTNKRTTLLFLHTQLVIMVTQKHIASFNAQLVKLLQV